MLMLLIWLRYLAVAGQLLTIAFVQRHLEIPLPTWTLLAISGALLVFNVFTHTWRGRKALVNERLLALQLIVDVAALTGLLYFSGGPANPFVSLYLVPIALAAVALARGPLLTLTVVTIACYTWLLAHHIPLPHSHGNSFDLHITGMWVNFLLSAGIMAGALAWLVAQVKATQEAAAKDRERAQRDESLLALGTLAAATAHELNTPLTTLGLLTEQLREIEGRPLKADLDLMASQLNLCRDHVRTLVRIAQDTSAGTAAETSADAFVMQCLEQWQLLRPTAHWLLEAGSGDARIRPDAALAPAVINLLNNAADASQRMASDESIVISHTADTYWLRIEIRDRGPGPQAVGLARTGRSAGLGLGLAVATASLEQAGGQLRVWPREGGGTVTEIRLPVLREARP